MILAHPERGRTIPTEYGTKVLKAWVGDADNIGESGARALHIKSLHTKRGFASKVASFAWLDVPYRAVGAAVRAGYQPGKTCPLCLALAEAGLNSRGKR